MRGATDKVRDLGEGIPAEKQIEQKTSGGIGFRGMRERIAQLGDSLEVQSDRNGTVVTAILPSSKRDRCRNERRDGSRFTCHCLRQD